MLQTNIQKGAFPRPQLASHGRAGWGSAHDQVKDYFWSFSLNLFNLTFFYQKRDQWDCVQLQPPPHDSLSRQHVHNNVAHPVVPAPGILYTETEKCVFTDVFFKATKCFHFQLRQHLYCVPKNVHHYFSNSNLGLMNFLHVDSIISISLLVPHFF